MNKLKKAFYLQKYYGINTLLKSIKNILLGSISSSQPIEYRIIFDVLKGLQSNNRIMMDIGAAFGSATEPFAKTGWQCYVFEPAPKNWEILKKNLKNYPLVTLENRAVSSASQKRVGFYTDSTSWGTGSLAPFSNTHSFDTFIDTTSLTDYCYEKKISQIGFLKIDAEGFDFPILQGFPWNICHPEIILCEFDELKMNNWSWKELVLFLKDLDYFVLTSEWNPIKNYGENHTWKALHEFPENTLTNKRAWGNVIAIKDIDTAYAIRNKFKKFAIKA